jgi:hypothetical protein
LVVDEGLTGGRPSDIAIERFADTSLRISVARVGAVAEAVTN